MLHVVRMHIVVRKYNVLHNHKLQTPTVCLILVHMLLPTMAVSMKMI